MSSTAASTEMSSKSQAARQPFSNQEAMETQRTTTSVDSQEEKCELQTVGNEHMDARIELEATSNEKVAVPIESTNESLKSEFSGTDAFLKLS